MGTECPASTASHLTADVVNEWSYTLTFPLCLNGYIIQGNLYP
jgi:hypothetical protein